MRKHIPIFLILFFILFPFPSFTIICEAYTINGQITGDISDGILITLSGNISQSTTTNVDGLYEFFNLNDGIYTITPNLEGYTFTPSNRQVTISGADQTGVDFTSEATYSLSGYLSGDIKDKVPVELYEWGVVCGNPSWEYKKTDRSELRIDCNGSYGIWSFLGNTANNYKIVPKFGRYSFYPEYWEGTLPPEQTNISFEMTQPDPLYINAIVCLGDSHTNLDTYPAHLSLLTGLPYFNEGIPGDRITKYWKKGELKLGMSGRFYEDVESYFASNCVLLGGINDIVADVPLLDIQTALADIFEHASNKNIRLTVVSVLPFKGNQWWNETRQSVLDSLNQWLQNKCLNDSNATYVNAYNPLEDPNCEDALLPEYSGGDHLHLTTSGYEKLGDEVYLQSFQ